MKTTTVSTLVAALALSFAAGSAMAQEATYDYPTAQASQKSRAEVETELRQARAEGSVVQGEASAPRATAFVSQLTRAQVHAQTLAAIASGEVHALNSETNAFDIPPRAAPASTMIAGK